MATATETIIERPKLSRWPWIVAALWICASLGGMWMLWQYAGTPGLAAEPPTHWPQNGLVQLSPQGNTLVMFVHPQCPCTRASMTELQKIIARSQGSVTPWVVVYKPGSSEANWEKTDLWLTAAATPGTHVIADVDGAEARRFHAATSGQTVLYDADGNLQFSGGITESRGHEGDNVGSSSIVDLLTTGATTCRETPVFGCPILPVSKAN